MFKQAVWKTDIIIIIILWNFFSDNSGEHIKTVKKKKKLLKSTINPLSLYKKAQCQMYIHSGHTLRYFCFGITFIKGP